MVPVPIADAIKRRKKVDFYSDKIRLPGISASVLATRNRESNRVARTDKRAEDRKFQEVYSLLYDHFGPQGWWPGETPFETMVGAVLAQNTNWPNVTKAIKNLRNGGTHDL